jgi:hypothetical protein
MKLTGWREAVPGAVLLGLLVFGLLKGWGQ